MDFSSFEKDLEELRSDPKVRLALESGVELLSYSVEIERELEGLVRDSIPDYVREAPETAALNAEIEACDGTLENIQNILNEFQRDLGGISDEIKTLQDESLTMGIKLKNRRDVESRLRLFLERLTVPEDLVTDICDKEVTQEYSDITLRKLDEKMSFARERETGIVLNAPAKEIPGVVPNLLQQRVAMERKDTSEPPDTAPGSPSRSTVPALLTLSIPPCETAAAQDVEPQLEKLRLRATAKIRVAFLERIALLKKPSTNVQMLQQDLIRFRYAMGFLQRHTPNVAEEVRSTYVESMRAILNSLFKTYHAQLLKFVHSSSGSVVVNPAAALFGGGAQSDSGDLIASLQRKADPMPLTLREQETGAPDAPPLVIHLIQNKQLSYEATFRSEEKHLIDSATTEYLFLLEFFGASSAEATAAALDGSKRAKQVTDHLFDQVFGKTLQAQLDQLDVFLANAHDPVALLLIIKTAQAHRSIMRKRRVLALESYFDKLDQKVWPQIKRVIDANIKSLMTADARKLMGPKLDPHAPHWIRRYALFAASVYAVASALGENSDGSIPAALGIARNKCIELLDRSCLLFTNPKFKAVFMINSCDSILGAFSDVGRVLQTDGQKFEELLSINKNSFVEEELQECFGRMIKFVRQSESEDAKIDDAEVKALVSDFAANWRSGMELINASIVTNFTSRANGKDILGSCLTQLCLYYQRFREICQDRPGIKGSKKLIEMTALLQEVDRYSKAV